MLTDALGKAAAGLKAFADQMAAVSGKPVQIQVQATGADRAEAEAIKRGQRPEQVAAMKKALGL